MTRENGFPRLKSIGLNGVLVQFADHFDDAQNRAALAFGAALKETGWTELEEVVSTLASTYIRFDFSLTSHEAIENALIELLNTQDWTKAPLPSGRRRFTIPCVFGGDAGPQFDEAAEVAGLSPKKAIEEITQSTPRVIAIGFAPGQPYMGELPKHWDIPRLTELSKNVPQGALVCAIRQLIIFSAPSPTGWRHIGTTAFRCFRPEQNASFAFKPGDEVTFTSITASELREIEQTDKSGNGGAEIEVIS